MPQFQREVTDDIEALRELLAEKYSPATVFRELLQNADDSKATELHFRILPPDSNHINPLLSVPGLLVLNNGMFRPGDAVGIARLRSGTKTADTAAIGKFGLGLKSVFHFGEAFLYAASANQPGANNAPFLHLLNPWGDTHAVWETDLGGFWERIAGEASHYFGMGAPWFALYVPLRTRTLCGDISPILPQYPTPEELFAVDRAADLARHLPLLRHIVRITVAKVGGDLQEAELISGAGRRLGPDEKTTTAEQDFSGVVRVSRPHGGSIVTHEIRYGGRETFGKNAYLARLKDDPTWPRRFSTDAQTGGRKEVKEKAEPHAAVLFLRTPTTSTVGGAFRLQEAVFMPLADRYSCDGVGLDFDTLVLLHGYYFLDSGRQRRLKTENDPVRGAWNDILLRQITLPQLLPAFANYVRTVPESAVSELTRRLHSVLEQAFAGERSYYCEHQQWLGRAKPVGLDWRLVPMCEPFYELPEPRDGRGELPFLLFPRLAGASECLTWAHLPRLTNAQPADLAGLAPLFADLQTDLIVKDTGAREYLGEFLKSVGKRLPMSVWVSLWKSLARALTPEVIAQFDSSFAKFVAGTVTYLPDVSEDHKRAELGAIPLFRVYETGAEKQTARLASWNELASCREKGTLFLSTGAKMADALREALAPPITVLRVADSSAPALLFGENHEVEACDDGACLRLLRNKQPALRAEPRHRLDLLSQLLPKEKARVTAWRKELRYLLHADRSAFGMDDFALFAPPRGTDVWSRLMNALMAGQNERKCAVAPLLLGPLSSDHKDALGVKEIDAQHVGDKLYERFQTGGAEGLASLPWRDADAFPILTALGGDKRPERIRLWRALPLHESMGGALVSLSDKRLVCRSRGTLGDAVPEPVAPLIVSVREPGDANLARCYDEAGIFPFQQSLVAEAICATGRPQDYRLPLLSALAIAYAEAPLPEPFKKVLRLERWLLAEDGALLCPSDILHLPGLEDTLARLLTRPTLRGLFWDTRAVAQALRTNKAWSVIVRDLLPSRDDAFETLAECVCDDDEFPLGTGRVAIDAQTLLAAFRHETDSQPWGLLYAVAANYPDYLTELVEHLQTKPLAPERRAAYLRDLQTRLANGSGDVAATEQTFRYFLGQVETAAELRESGVHLRSAAGAWRDPATLCRPDEIGIAGSNRLDVELFRVLETILEAASRIALPRQTLTPDVRDLTTLSGADAAKAVGEYFADWNLERETIGAFLTVLASDPAFLPLAKEYVGVRIMDVDRREMGLPRIDMSRVSFSLRFQKANQNTHRVRNLWQEFIPAQVADKSPHILLGKPNWVGIGVKERVIISLRHLATDPERTADSLRQSLESILHHLEGSLKPEHWEQFCQPDRTKLATAQTLILRSLPFYANQLKKDGWRLLRPVLRDLDNLRYQEEQARGIKDAYARNNVQQQVDDCQSKLRGLLSEDKEAQHEILSGVRKSVEQFQYTVDCVPFELFQNADDACVERGELDYAVPEPRFVAEEYAQGITVAHNGRPINRYRGAKLNAEMGQERGFHRDLEKMLVLSFSDKNDGADAEAVTGKFGLGFKSVLLYTDKPMVLSDALGFQVVGGVYPVALGEKAKSNIQTYRERLMSAKDATLIQLPRREGTGADVMNRFVGSLPYLLAFARKIKSASVKTNGKSVAYEWRETVAATGVWLGESGTEKCLVIRGDNGAALLLRLGARGIEALPPAVPTFWVTAPTREGTTTGYAINAPFSVDVGRAQLAADKDENNKAADALAGAVARGLTALFDGGWEVTVSRLRLAADTEPYGFWESIWARLAVRVEGSDGAKHLANRVIRGANGDCGYVRFLRDRAALPSGLPGAHQELLTLGSARFVAGGLLLDRERFVHVAGWKGFAAQFPPGTVVSENLWTRVLDWGSTPTPAPKPLRLVQVLSELVPDKCVSAEQAAAFGSVITREVLNEETSVHAEEIPALRELLHQLCFASVTGRPMGANALLITAPPERQHKRDRGDAEDERLRIGFAPLEHVLSADYLGQGDGGEQAITFLLACRDNQMRVIDAKRLAQWGREARTTSAKIAFLRYLLNGQLKTEIARQLHQTAENTWLKSVDDEPFWPEFSLAEQAQLSGLLNRDISHAELQKQTGGAADPDTDEAEDVEDETDALQPKLVQRIFGSDVRDELKRLATDWAINGAERLRQYERKRYPDVDALFARLKGDTTTVETRMAWMTILLSASLETIGRARPEAHRGFLVLCGEKGWLRTLAESGDETPSPQLLRPFERWLDDAIQEMRYVTWAKELLPGLLLSRYAAEYAQTFRGLENWREDNKPFPMLYIDAPRLSPSGADAPPLKPFLGIGTHYILRELLRKGVLTNPRLHSAAFVPGRRVKDWAVERGANLSADDSHEIASRELYRWLREHLTPEEATFGGAFDIAIREASIEAG